MEDQERDQTEYINPNHGIYHLATESDGLMTDFWDQIYKLKLNEEVVLAISKLIWPEFIEKDGFIFLEENYELNYYEELIAEGDPNIEATINTTYLDRIIFPKSEVSDGKVWDKIGRLLVQTWVAKAQLCFPNKKFKAEFQWYSDDGDPGIYICQDWRYE